MPLTFGENFSHSATGRGTATFGANLLHIDARTLGSNVRYRYQNAGWLVEAVGYASTSKTWMRHVSKGHFNTVGIALLNPAGVRVNFDDIRPEGPRSIRAFDASNREIDLLDIRSSG